MAAISRREFFRKAATDAAVVGLLAAAAGEGEVNANPLGLPIGSQTYPHRQRIQSGDFAGLLKDMKGDRHRRHRTVLTELHRVRQPRRREGDQENPRRQRPQVSERALRDERPADRSSLK